MSSDPHPPPSPSDLGSAPQARGGPQRILRPLASTPGPPAPWLGRPPERVTIAEIRRAFGRRPWLPVASAPRNSDGLRPAAVLCPFFDDGDQAWVVLTRRSNSLRLHTGEVSFPGGRLDEGEEPAAAALREAHEEVGIDPATVELLGHLSIVTSLRSSAPIVPFVGVLAGGLPTLVANPAEVERVITVPVAELFADEVHREESWQIDASGVRPFYFFELVGDTVWGMTARILRELLEILWADRADRAATDWAASPA